MDKIITNYKTVKMNPNFMQTVNTQTGELNEFGNEEIFRRIKTNEVRYDYDSYVYLNTERLILLLLAENSIKHSELALLIMISLNLRFEYNICMIDNEHPHTSLSISKMISNEYQPTKNKLNRLIKIGVLAYQKIPGREDLGKVYIVNPLYIRKGIKFSSIIPRIFNDIVN